MKAIPLIVNRVLNNAGLRSEIASTTRSYGVHVIAYGPRSNNGEARPLLEAAEQALIARGYLVEWHIYEGVNNTYLTVKEGTR